MTGRADAGGPDALPSRWEMVPLRFLVRTRAGGTPTSTSEEYWDEHDGIPWLSIADMGDADTDAPHAGRFLTASGVAASRLVPSRDECVLFAMYASVGEVAHLRSSAVWNQAILGLEPRPHRTDARFLYWSMKALKPTLPYYFRSNTQDNLNAEQVRALRVPCPPLDVQRAIADFLDRETAQIDAFIAKNEELITLLTERRAALTARVATKGLNPDIELRPSGVDWLGQVPSHWKISRLSRWFSVTLGKMLDAAKNQGDEGTPRPYVRAANIRPGRLDLTSVNEMPFSITEQKKYSLERGDLLVVEGGSIGVNAPLAEDLRGWGFQKTVTRLRPRQSDSAAFVGLQLDIMREAGAMEMLANVSTILHFTAEKLERSVVAMPPPSEQRAIVEYVRNQTAPIDECAARTRRAIELARERRSALISAAVTGKIDVGVGA